MKSPSPTHDPVYFQELFGFSLPHPQYQITAEKLRMISVAIAKHYKNIGYQYSFYVLMAEHDLGPMLPKQYVAVTPDAPTVRGTGINPMQAKQNLFLVLEEFYAHNPDKIPLLK